jgi:hypothetical protein
LLRLIKSAAALLFRFFKTIAHKQIQKTCPKFVTFFPYIVEMHLIPQRITCLIRKELSREMRSQGHKDKSIAKRLGTTPAAIKQSRYRERRRSGVTATPDALLSRAVAMA